jgi:AcrR family transcriptional regulator
MTVTVKDSGGRRTGTKLMPRAEREQQLLDIAERAFAQRGYHAVSMEEIASAAGVTKPMIYSYFGSKQGLYGAGIKRAYDDLAERVEAAAASADSPGEQIWRVNRAVFEWFDEYREHWPYVYGAQALGGEVAAQAATSRAGMVAVIAKLLRDLVADSVDQAEIEPLAEAAVAVNTALADRWYRHPDEPRELQEERSMRILWPAVAALAGVDAVDQ